MPVFDSILLIEAGLFINRGGPVPAGLEICTLSSGVLAGLQRLANANAKRTREANASEIMAKVSLGFFFF
jgi:hypothetical protein